MGMNSGAALTGPEHFNKAMAIIDNIDDSHDAAVLAIVALTHAQLAHTEALLNVHGRSWAQIPK